MSKASHAFLGAAAGICIGSYFLVMGQPIHRPAPSGTTQSSPVQIYVNAADCNSPAAKTYVADVITANKSEIAAGRINVSCVQTTFINSLR